MRSGPLRDVWAVFAMAFVSVLPRRERFVLALGCGHRVLRIRYNRPRVGLGRTRCEKCAERARRLRLDHMAETSMNLAQCVSGGLPQGAKA